MGRREKTCGADEQAKLHLCKRAYCRSKNSNTPLAVKRLTAVGEIRRIRLFILFVAGLILLQIVGCLVGGTIGSLIGSAVGGLIIGFLCVLIGLVLHEESLLQIFRNSRMDQWKTTHVPLTILV
jgi:hypothetical protein